MTEDRPRDTRRGPPAPDNPPGRGGRPRWGRTAEPIRDAAFRRTLLRAGGLLLGVLVIALAFVAAYAGALHDPDPHDLPVGVARDDQAAERLLTAVRARTDTVRAASYDDRAAADEALRAREVYAVLASGPDGLTLVTASAGSPAAAEAVTATLGTAAGTAGTPLATADAIPTSTEDPRGLVPFYLAIGLVLGGYLASAALGVSIGTTPRGLARAGLRIGAFAIHAVLLGLGGALITGPGFGVLDRHVASVAGAGAVIAFAAALTAAAIQGWLGLAGTGLVILLLVVLGNPGSGGIYAPEFLPGPFTSMHRWNIPGLATDLVKSVAYFPPAAAHWPLIRLAGWALAGLVLLLAAARVLGPRRRPRSPT